MFALHILRVENLVQMAYHIGNDRPGVIEELENSIASEVLAFSVLQVPTKESLVDAIKRCLDLWQKLYEENRERKPFPGEFFFFIGAFNLTICGND